MEKKKYNFKDQIETQLSLIKDLKANINFILEFNEFCKVNEKLVSNSIIRIYFLIQHDTVLCLYKLINSNQDYSIDKLKSTASRLETIQTSSENFKEIKQCAKRIKKKYHEMDINNLRNEYLGHLDINRKDYSLKHEDLKMIISELVCFYNSIELLVGKEKTDFNLFHDKSVVPILEMTIEYDRLFNNETEELKKRLNLK